MKDMEEQLLKLRAEAERCSNIDTEKRDLFAKLEQHFNVLALEIAGAIAAKESAGPSA